MKKLPIPPKPIRPIRPVPEPGLKARLLQQLPQRRTAALQRDLQVEGRPGVGPGLGSTHRLMALSTGSFGAPTSMRFVVVVVVLFLGMEYGGCF